MAPNVWENVTLKYWHGGRFNYDRNGMMMYFGGHGKTSEVCIDELCYWELLELAKKAGDYSSIEGLYYKLHGLNLKEGLRKVNDDSDVLAMGEIAMKYRTIEYYVQHQEKEASIDPKPQPKTVTHFQPYEASSKLTSRPKKLTPKKGGPILGCTSSSTQASHINTSIPTVPQNTLHQSDDYDCSDWIDPLSYNHLFTESNESDDDPLYKPQKEGSLSDGDDERGIDELEAEMNEAYEEFQDEEDGYEEVMNEMMFDGSDDSDEEIEIARKRVKSCTAKLLEIAQQLQAEAAKGKLSARNGLKEAVEVEQERGENGYESEYYETDEEIESEEEMQTVRKSKRSLLVGLDTDFKNFQWKVGQRFTSKDDFKQAVSKYAVMQGKDLVVVISNKARRQELGIKCIEGCPFYLYASWHSRNATFIVRRVVNEHLCQRVKEK